MDVGGAHSFSVASVTNANHTHRSAGSPGGQKAWRAQLDSVLRAPQAETQVPVSLSLIWQLWGIICFQAQVVGIQFCVVVGLPIPISLPAVIHGPRVAPSQCLDMAHV